MKVLLIAALFSGANISVASETKQGQSEFYIEEGLAQKIYDDMESERAVGSTTQMLVGAELASPREMFLSSRYFGVDYAENPGSLQSVNVGFSKSIVALKDWEFDGSFQAGYGYTKGAYRAKSKNGLEVQDDIGLQWIPVRGSFIVGYQIPGTYVVKPEAEAGLGSHFFMQSGSLDGMTQTFWLITYFGGVRVRFFSQKQVPGSTFGGVILGARYEEQTGDTQKLRHLSYSLTTSFSL